VKPYYQDDAVTIYHGDCREALPTLTADCCITDPPYGIDLGNHNAGADTRQKHLHKKGYDSYRDTLESLRSMVVPAVAHYISVSKRAAVFCAPTNIGEFPKPDAVGGIYLPSGCGRSRWGFTNFSSILLYGQHPTIGNGCRPTMIVSTDTAESNGHPVPKPLSWMTWLVGFASLEGETIIDPFMGSGTTLRAAKDLGRKAIGIEIEERYCEIAARRMAQEVLPL
jgi:site-specific DNA-methyltransferase (adenine-specific)